MRREPYKWPWIRFCLLRCLGRLDPRRAMGASLRLAGEPSALDQARTVTDRGAEGLCARVYRLVLTSGGPIIEVVEKARADRRPDGRPFSSRFRGFSPAAGRREKLASPRALLLSPPT